MPELRIERLFYCANWPKFEYQLFLHLIWKQVISAAGSGVRLQISLLHFGDFWLISQAINQGGDQVNNASTY